MATSARVIADDAIRVLDHGFVRLDDAMATDLSVVNAARVSFARRKDQMDEGDEGLIRFLMRDRHGTPFEHNAFRFHVRAPIFVAREWFRHRVGCLTGDTVVTFVDTNGRSTPTSRKTIDELYSMWTLGERDRRALAPDGYRDARRRIRAMRLRVLDESSDEFATGHVADIIDKGVQPVYKLTLADGKSVGLTANHRILTDEGWQRMGEAIGLSGSAPAAQMTRRCRVMVNGVPVQRDVAAIRSAARTRRCKIIAHPVEVVAVAYVGLRQTYDLSVAGEWHNFVANGIVVHNSFNEFSMRYAKATDDFYVPEPEDVRTQIGKPGAYSFEPVADELAERTRDELREVYDTAFATYQRLVDAGVARELARAVMPVGAYTEFFWTVNARALMNFVSLRAAETAQREIRRYAEAVERFFGQKMPVTYDAFVAAGRVAP